MPIAVSLTTEEKCLLHAVPITEGGNEATIDGAVQWAVDSGTCTLVPDTDTSVWCLAGASGVSVVRATCDADLGAGVVPVEDVYNVTVTNANAESLELTADAPVLK